MTPFQEKMLAIDRGNQESARIILAAPHLDLGSLEVQWARAVLSNNPAHSLSEG